MSINNKNELHETVYLSGEQLVITQVGNADLNFKLNYEDLPSLKIKLLGDQSSSFNQNIK